MEGPTDIVRQVCDLLKEEGVPVSYHDKTSTCTVRKGGGIDITLSNGDLIVRNRNRDTIFVFTNPSEVEHAVDVYHGEDVVRVRGKEGVLEIRNTLVGDKRIRFVVSFDVDKDGKMDAAAVRVWR